MEASYYKKYEPIFGSWTIKREIGEGNFGAVYEIVREDFGTTYTAALKTITVPKSKAELDSLIEDGMDPAATYEQIVKKIVGEFVLMSKLKGNSNIVSYEDHQVIRHPDGIGWDILIRMELLTPMMTHFRNNVVTRKDVIKVGIDMCRALELCQRHNIIHRDIKPENIFISPGGDYKLGDFGIAKEVEVMQSGLTKAGTPTYMAPEVYHGQPYNASVDMYSLGVVLYRLLNNNRAPFMPPHPKKISFSDKENALSMRLSGKPFPPPTNVTSPRLTNAIMKACSYRPQDRFENPVAFREELENILSTEGDGIVIAHTDHVYVNSVSYVSNTNSTYKVPQQPVPSAAYDEEETVLMDMGNTTEPDDGTVVMSANFAAPAQPKSAPQTKSTPQPKPVQQPKKKSGALVPILIACIALIVLLVGGIAVFSMMIVGNKFVTHEKNDIPVVPTQNVQPAMTDDDTDVSGGDNIQPAQDENTELTLLPVDDVNKEQNGVQPEQPVIEMCALCSSSEHTAHPFSHIAVLVDGSVEFNEGVMDVNGIIYAPVRKLAEAMNYNVKWNDETQSVVVYNETLGVYNINARSTSVTVINNLTGSVDATEFESAIIEYNDSLYVPLQNFIQLLGAELDMSDPTAINIIVFGEQYDTAEVCTYCGSASHTSDQHPACIVCGSRWHSVHCAICNSKSHNTSRHPICPTCGSTSHTVHPVCAVCGSNSHTVHPSCSYCGSYDHTVHPVCQVCGSYDHASHPACPVCGGADHSVDIHPSCSVCESYDHTVHIYDTDF